MSDAEHDSKRERAHRLAAELQWVDDELAVPSEELLVWLEGSAGDDERAQVAGTLAARGLVRSALWREAPIRTGWRLLSEHRGVATACCTAVALLAFVVTRSSESRAAQALDSAQFARAQALLDPDAAASDQILGWTFGGSMLRNSPQTADERRPLAPCGVVLETRPRFEWSDEAPRVVRVLDFEGRELWAWRGSARSVEYAGEVPLALGGRYRAVVALEGERRVPLGFVFTVAAAERLRELEAALESAHARAGDDERCREFARAAVLARAGFTGDAGRALEHLAHSMDSDARARLAQFLVERSAPQLAERVARSR